MPGLFELVGRLRARLGPTGRLLLHRAMYEAIYSVPAVARLGFFNGGYHPLPPDLVAVPDLAGAPWQAAFYDLALRVMPNGRPRAPFGVLDIGCGTGGGLLYAAAAFPGARLAGVDQSRRGVVAARRRLAAAGWPAELHVAPAHRLPFPDASFDLVVSIGTLTYVGFAPFFAEAARVLEPGGVLSVTGGTQATPIGWTRARLEKHARAAGLAPIAFRDVTAGCFAALAAQAERNAALVGRLPRPFRAYAREWAVLPGSQRHALYLAGEKKEFAAAFVKPAASPSPARGTGEG
jgi:SAM-dependent methyltransferase